MEVIWNVYKDKHSRIFTVGKNATAIDNFIWGQGALSRSVCVCVCVCVCE